MRRRAIPITLVVLAAAVPVAAQIGNPGGMSPSTPLAEPGKPAPHQPNTQDRLFFHLAGTGGMAEVDAARLAERKASHAAVKEFARRMGQDHAKANEQLAGLARAARIALPDGPAPDHKAQRAELDAASGGAFDAAYMQQQLVEHQKTVTLLQWEISSGQDADLQRYAMQNLPIVLEHLEMAQRIIAELTGAPPAGLAASSVASPRTSSEKPDPSAQRPPR
jgi:putative membrane protein